MPSKTSNKVPSSASSQRKPTSSKNSIATAPPTATAAAAPPTAKKGPAASLPFALTVAAAVALTAFGGAYVGKHRNEKNRASALSAEEGAEGGTVGSSFSKGGGGGGSKAVFDEASYASFDDLASYFSAERGFEHYGDRLKVLFRKIDKDAIASDAAARDELAAALSPAALANGLDTRDRHVIVGAPLRAGLDALLRVPRIEVIDADLLRGSDAMSLMIYGGGKHVTDLGAHSFQQVFAYAFFLMHERRKGTASRLHAWLSSLPASFAHEGGAVYWPEHVAHCLDERTAAEFIATQTIVGTVLQGAEACSELPEEAYKEDEVMRAIASGAAEPFSIEEARWAVSVYLRYNVNDQLILPGLNYFRRSSEREGVAVRPASDGRTVEIISPRDLVEGEEPVWNFNRGPGTSLNMLGDFDAEAAWTEVPMSLPEPSNPKSVVARLCHERRRQLLFSTTTGRPREEVVQCLGAVLATTKEQKKNLFNLRTREPALLVDIYGNLTGIAYRQMSSIINATRSERCTLEGVPQPQQDRIVAYLRRAAQTYNTITMHLYNETERLSALAGIPFRLAAKEGGESSSAKKEEAQEDKEG